MQSEAVSAAERWRVMHHMVACGVKAPSPQNRQPWVLQPIADCLDLYLDPTRVAAQTDPFARQAHIALGAFLELCALAASDHGYTARFDLFPDGVDPTDTLGLLPVARISLVSGLVQRDPLVDFAEQRHTNRRVYHGPSLTPKETRALEACGNAGAFPIVVENDQLQRAICDLMVQAMKIDTDCDATHNEKVSMVRASDASAAQSGDGFTYPNLGYTGRSRQIVEWMYPLSGGSSRWFRHGTTFVARRVVRSAPNIGLLVSNGNDRVHQLHAGRVLARTWLTAAQLGLQLHPMCQILQERIEQELPQATFLTLCRQLIAPVELPDHRMTPESHTAQMVFRLGRATPTPRSPRRTIEGVLRP